MKISTIKSLLNITADAAIIEELKTELAKMEAAEQRKTEKAAEKASEYAAAHDVVFALLETATAPVTAAEIYDSINTDLPDGFTKNKISYAFRTYWADEVEATTTGKGAKSYQRKNTGE